MTPSVHIDNIGEMAIVECAGRFVRNEAAFQLRDAVTSQADARVVVLDLTEMHAIGGGGLGMLVLLQYSIQAVQPLPARAGQAQAR
jgi:anti-anti-sigma regulatory factor